MHFRWRELACPSNLPLYRNIDISDVILSQSMSCFAKYVKSNTFHDTMLHVMLRTVIHATIPRYK